MNTECPGWHCSCMASPACMEGCWEMSRWSGVCQGCHGCEVYGPAGISGCPDRCSCAWIVAQGGWPNG